MAKRDDVVIRFGSDDSAVQKTIKKLSGATGALATKFKDLGNSIADAFGIGAGIAGGGVVASVAQLTKQLDELGKTADALNTTVEDLSALQFAISQTSTATDRDLNMALQRLVKHIGQANRGAKESQKIFQEIGLSWEYLSTLNSDQAFLEVSEAIAQIDDEYKQASIAQKLFEDNWRTLLPTLKAGATTLKQLVEQAKQMGVPTTEAAQAAADLNDSLGRLNRNMDALTFKYGPALIELLNTLITKWTDLNDETDEGLIKEMMGVNRQIEVLERRVERMGWFFGDEWIKEQQEDIRLLRQYWMELSMSVKETGDSAAEANNNMKNMAPGLLGELKAKPGTKESKKQDDPVPVDVVRVAGKPAKPEPERPTTFASGTPITTQKGRFTPSDRFTPSPRYPHLAGGTYWQGPGNPQTLANPLETATAIDAYHRGEITATELGKRIGLQSGDTQEPAAGAFGSMGNLSRGLPSQQEADIVRLSPDISSFSQLLKRTLSEEEYIVKVRPVIVDDSQPMEPLIDKVGGRD